MYFSIIIKYCCYCGIFIVLMSIYKLCVRIESVVKFSEVNINMVIIDNVGYDKYCCMFFFNGDGRLYKELFFYKVFY